MGIPSLSSRSFPNSSVLLMHTPGGSRAGLKTLDSYHPGGRPKLSLWLLVSAWSCLTATGIGGMNQQMEALVFALLLSLFEIQIERNFKQINKTNKGNKNNLLHFLL